MPPRPVQGTVVLITGATSGIGRETALAFAQAGARLTVSGRRQERLHDLVREIEAGGGEALAVAVDVSDPEQVEWLVKRTLDRYGRIDTLINNAGVGSAAPFIDQSLDDFRRLMEINFWGVVHGCKAAVPSMRRQPNGGLIVNVASILGKRGVPFETAYCASKFAVAGFSEALRTELMSAKIDVTTVFPGLVETEIFATAANLTGLTMPDWLPKMPTRDLARLLVQNARLPQPEIVVGLDAVATNALNTFAPGLVDVVLGQSLPFLEGLRGAPPSPPPLQDPPDEPQPAGA